VSRIKARLDQILLANYSMIASEVQSEYIPQDEIITQDTLIFAGSNFKLRAKSDCATRIQWTPATGLSNSFILQPDASPLQHTRYYLKTEQAFCKTEDSVLVKVIDTSAIDCEALKLPTAFTPNQDGINDVFFISNNYIIEKLSFFDIYDRNGSLMVRFTNPQDSWDGSWNGSILQPGTYYYRILYSCKDKDYSIKGSFFLLR
jgi:gliding motility-associated-like protein